ncbi:hypothetical protein Bca101_084454 [Brassica carinata]
MSHFWGRFKVMVSDPPFNHLLFLFAVVSISRAPALANVSADPIAEGSIDVLPPKKKRKRAKSLKEVRADPSEDEREAARTPREPRDDDEMEDNREEIHVENSKGLSGKGSSGGELHPPSEATRHAVNGTSDISKLMFPNKFSESARADADVNV